MPAPIRDALERTGGVTGQKTSSTYAGPDRSSAWVPPPVVTVNRTPEVKADKLTKWSAMVLLTTLAAVAVSNRNSRGRAQQLRRAAKMTVATTNGEPLTEDMEDEVMCIVQNNSMVRNTQSTIVAILVTSMWTLVARQVAGLVHEYLCRRTRALPRKLISSLSLAFGFWLGRKAAIATHKPYVPISWLPARINDAIGRRVKKLQVTISLYISAWYWNHETMQDNRVKFAESVSDEMTWFPSKLCQP